VKNPMKATSKRLVISILVLGLAIAPWLCAQEKPGDPEATEKIDYEALLEQAKKDFLNKKGEFEFEPAKPPEYIQDEKTRSLYLKSWQAYYDYLSEGLAYRLKVFRWQARSSIIIFYSVLVLVFAGILFSGIQFYKSMKFAGDKEKEGNTNQPLTEFEASASGIKVSSPVLGVIILVISLAFFYLYLVYVYPIQETF
jgi:hypothetical protein